MGLGGTEDMEADGCKRKQAKTPKATDAPATPHRLGNSPVKEEEEEKSPISRWPRCLWPDAPVNGSSYLPGMDQLLSSVV